VAFPAIFCAQRSFAAMYWSFTGVNLTQRRKGGSAKTWNLALGLWTLNFELWT
jgi:hypothetical protein